MLNFPIDNFLIEIPQMMQCVRPQKDKETR